MSNEVNSNGDETPVVVESFMDTLNATLAQLWLTQNGLDASLAGDDLAHMLYHVIAARKVELLVPSHQVVQATELLSEFHKANANANHGPWQCPNCRELCGSSFDECWQCGHGHQQEYGITAMPTD